MKRKKDHKESPPDKEAQESAQAENRFTREQLLSSARFRDRRDLLGALLEPGRLYTIAEAEGKIEKYRKGKVK